MQYRDYQQDLHDRIYSQWSDPKIKNVTAVLPTGGGKSLVVGGVVKQWDRGEVCCIAHRKELVGQIALALATSGVRHKIIGPRTMVKYVINRQKLKLGTHLFDANAQVTVASVDTLIAPSRRSGLKSWAEQVGLWVLDECFPAGTLVDGVPIECIRVGDFVTAFNEATGGLEKRKVTRLFKNPAPASLVRVQVGHHVVQCTYGHPIWTQRGWVNAGDITTTDHVSVLHNVPPAGGSLRPPKKAARNNRAGILFERLLDCVSFYGFLRYDGGHQPEVRVGTYGKKQPHAESRDAEESVRHPAYHGAPAVNTRGERPAGDGSRSKTTRTTGSLWLRLANYCSHWGERVLPQPLQDRLWPREIETGGGSGRLQSLRVLSPSTRPQEGPLATWARVDRVEVLKSDNPHGARDGFVYNLEVDGLHTYVANGIVVHNCHHLLRANKWGTATDMFPNANGLGVTATPVRADGRGLGRHADGVMDALVEGPTMRELIRTGYLCDYRIFAPLTYMPLTDDDVGASGDYSQAKLKAASKSSPIVGDVVASYKKFAAGMQAVVFATDLETAASMAASYNAAGIRAEVVSSLTPDRERSELLDRFERRELQVIINVDLLGEGFDCLSEDTEILTQAGWKSHDQVSVGDMMYALNTETERLELVPVDRVFSREARAGERMATLVSQHSDIRVTEGHQIFYKKHNDVIHWSDAGDLVKDARQFSIPLCGSYQFPGVPLSNDELRFIAWFITDGGFSRTYVSINQAKDFRNDIRALLTRLDFDFKERVRKRPPYRDLHEFNIPKGTHTGAYTRRGWTHLAAYLDKDISPLLSQMTAGQFDVFWEELLKGDGSHGQLCTAREKMVDRLSAMAVVRGRDCLINYSKTPQGKPFYYIRSKPRGWFRFKLKDARGARSALALAKPNERVWCVTNRNKTLISRRNGKIAILGNCPGIECVIFARPTKSYGLYCQQFGRGLRPLKGKTHAIIIDHVGNVVSHGLPDSARVWDLDGRDKLPAAANSDDDIPLRYCVECTQPYKRIYTECPWCGHIPRPDPRGGPEFRDGDVFEISPEILAKLRGEIATIDTDASVVYERMIAAGTPRAIAGATYKNIAARTSMQAALRTCMNWWGGMQNARGLSDREAYRLFFHTFGVDVLTAKTYNRRDAECLANKIIHRLGGPIL